MVKRSGGIGFLTFVTILLALFSGFMPRLRAVDNPDKPQKGTWSFNPRLVWSVVAAQDDILTSGGFSAIAGDGTVFYFDDKSSSVKAFNSEGEFLFSFGRKGEGPGEFKMVWDMTVMGDKLVVCDLQSYHLFDGRGQFIKTVKSPGEAEGLVTPELLLCSQEDEHNQSLFLHDLVRQTKTLLKQLKSPEKLIAQGGGIRLRVRDNGIVDGLFVDAGEGRIVFGQSAEYRLFVADNRGNILTSFGIPSRERPRIPEAYKNSRYSRLKLNGALLSASMQRQLASCIPDLGPHFNRIKLSDTGMIMVMLPEYQDTHRRFMDLFSPDGRYLYRAVIDMPDGLPFNQNSWALRGDSLVMYTEGEDDEGSLKKFRIDLPRED